MITPNVSTILDEGATYGLHRFKDGEVVLCVQHASGDWINLRPARDHEVKYFDRHGNKAAPSKKL